MIKYYLLGTTLYFLTMTYLCINVVWNNESYVNIEAHIETYYLIMLFMFIFTFVGFLSYLESREIN